MKTTIPDLGIFEKQKSMIKKIAYIILCLLLSFTTQAAMLDDFESYTVGSITSPWVQTHGSPVFGQETGGNQYLESYGSYLPLGACSIPDSDTETTVFFRIYEIAGTGPDCSIGLSHLPTPTGDWNDFEAYVLLVNGNLQARNNGSSTTIVSGITEGVWYNIWLVLNNNANTYDVYVTTGSDDATTAGAQKANDFGFRNDAGDLMSFKVFGRDWAPARIDDIHISAGTNLSTPSAEGYAPDTDTLHLYNFDDGTATDQAGTFDLALYEGAAISNSTLSTYNGGAGTTGYICADAAGYTNLSPLSNFIGADGSFTFEAMVKPTMEPGAAGFQEILSCESDSGAADNRGFQFRIESAGTTLRFQTLSGSVAAYDADISYLADNWYHAAVTFDASTGDLKMYWTPAGDPIAEVGSWAGVAALDGTTSTRFCIGNELRSTNGYGNENFEGVIDEVRISDIARVTYDMSTGSGASRAVIISDPNDTVVDEGQNASLDAGFASDFVPVVTWYKIASPSDIAMDPGSVQTTYDSLADEYTSTLTITNAAMLDAGQYYCEINNNSGNSQNSRTAALTVYGLIAHWTLDQSSYVGGDYQEEIGGYHAAVNGTPTFVAGADGIDNNAVQISATDGWALCPLLNPVNQAGQLTVSFWANWGEPQGTQQDLKAESSQGDQMVMTDGLTADGQWQHICAVFDGTASNGKLYVNGVLQDQISWPALYSTDAAINIGIDSSVQNPFNGALDDMRLYNYALTGTEVAAIYDAWADSCSLQYDFTGPSGQPDCVVNLYDLAEFANRWLTPPDNYDLVEFAEFAAEWYASGL